MGVPPPPRGADIGFSTTNKELQVFGRKQMTISHTFFLYLEHTWEIDCLVTVFSFSFSYTPK